MRWPRVALVVCGVAVPFSRPALAQEVTPVAAPSAATLPANPGAAATPTAGPGAAPAPAARASAPAAPNCAQEKLTSAATIAPATISWGAVEVIFEATDDGTAPPVPGGEKAPTAGATPEQRKADWKNAYMRALTAFEAHALACSGKGFDTLDATVFRHVTAEEALKDYAAAQ